VAHCNSTSCNKDSVEIPRGGFKYNPTQESVVVIFPIDEDPGLARAAGTACEDKAV